MKKLLLSSAALVALAIPFAAFAQSTGTIDAENDIVVTASTSNSNGVGGVVAPNTSKARAVLTQEFIAHQTPGQSINDIINQLPGVSFQNNDPFGSAGGKLSIRGFDNTRISQTFDGVPLNDSGSYALYSSQQLDPELIEQVNVNLGSTDVDSPSAAASGSTVNYRTRLPKDDFGARFIGSAGDSKFFRIFGELDTGVFTPWGTKAFFAASHSENDTVYDNYGKIDKQQYNARIYQPIGSNGDFISIAGHYNQSRNNFFGSVPLRTDTTGGRIVGPDSTNRFPITKDERFYTTARCQVNTVARANVPDVANSCGSLFDYRANPSNTGNIRVASRFTLAPKLVLTVDPNYQYVKANGGGSVVGQERRNPGSGQTGYIAGAPYFGRDLNGDGDLLDTVRLLAPSQTQTTRYGVIASLRYDLNEDHSIRVAYSLDHARHRQTGEVGVLKTDGSPVDVFPVNAGLTDVNGNILQKRDRLSYAILNQVSGEYRGAFFANSLNVNLGIRAPFFKRDLTNNCSTSSVTGNVECFGTNTVAAAAYAAANPTIQGPQTRVLKYNKVLPNAGLTYEITHGASVFANYSKGLQVPGTDNLYNAFFYAANTPQAQPKPETTDNFDVGMRYRTSKIQASVTGWYTRFTDRLGVAYDQELDKSVYRNLGKVDKYGVDASVAYQPIPEATLYVFGSYLKSKIKDNVQLSGGGAVDCNATPVPAGCALTAGKRESGSPTYTVGGRGEINVGPVLVGIQAKRTGPRYINDQNIPVKIAGVQVYGSKAPAYTLVDLDARLSLGFVGLNDKTYLQLNVSNLFDKLYVGGFDGTLSATQATNALIGSPRTFIGSVIVGF
ncbi:TonB-dependent receptor [soil metagenome]